MNDKTIKNTITISVEGSKVDISFEKPMNLDDFMATMFTAQLACMNQATPDKSNKDFTAIRDNIYDQFNIAASTTLMMYAPDNELRPDLTQEALKSIKNAEDDYMKAMLNRKTRRSLDKKKTKKSTKSSIRRVK